MALGTTKILLFLLVVFNFYMLGLFSSLEIVPLYIRLLNVV